MKVTVCDGDRNLYHRKEVEEIEEGRKINGKLGDGVAEVTRSDNRVTIVIASQVPQHGFWLNNFSSVDYMYYRYVAVVKRVFTIL
jgi:frataxin-like iron-binding protein CyaY